MDKTQTYTVTLTEKTLSRLSKKIIVVVPAFDHPLPNCVYANLGLHTQISLPRD